jgi:hypothetical protein
VARSLKRITVVLILAAAFLIAFLATTNATATLFKSQNSSVSYTFITTVVGVATNAVINPITLDGHSFTSSNIGHYTQTVQAGNCGTPSQVRIFASNFVPSDYVQFAVKITNTGTATLAFQSYTYCSYFVTATGTIINPPYPAPITGYPAPINPSSAQPWTLTNFGTDTLSYYLVKLSGSANWVKDFSYTSAPILPTTLAPGATFTYNLYIGLGANAPYGIPSNCFSLNIPLAIAPLPTPSPNPTHTPCPTCTPKPTPTTTPTPTPKPTCTPTPTHTPCPTATPKPTPSPTPTPKPTCVPTPTHTPCPTCTPKPTSTTTPFPTPKPTCTPTPTHTPCPTTTPKPTPTPKPTCTPTPTHTLCPSPKPTLKPK